MLPAGHRDGAVVEQLERDVHVRGDHALDHAAGPEWK
jgi:hypothetical protein